MTEQEYLNHISEEDTCGFLDNVYNWCSHRPLLYLCMQLTNKNKLPVLEMGCGIGSTNYLRQYCTEHNRGFVTYDSNKEWASKFNSVFIEDWGNSDIFDKQYSLVFIDHAPGGHRWVAIQKLADKCELIVFHDSELIGAGDYKYENIRGLFKYELDYNLTEGGAGCSAVSNTIDVTKFKGGCIGNFKFDV